MKPTYGPSWPLALLLVCALYPLFPAVDAQLLRLTGRSLGDQMPTLFIFAVLALALNVVVGYVGILHLGIAAFFGLGAYVTGILTVPAYPFEMGFYVAVVAATLVGALFGFLIGVPTLRLRGDYLALVTLGFGEVVRFSLRNLDAITAGTRGLNPVPPPVVPGLSLQWETDFRPFYYLTLLFLAGVYLLLSGLERSRLGRAWVAIREDELAANCMGLNTGRLKLAAFVLSAALAGLAGCLYATKYTSTGFPDAYDFNRSVFMLCCLILGGIGSRNGVLLGVTLLFAFEYLLSPVVDERLQAMVGPPSEKTVDLFGGYTVTFAKEMQTFAGWRLFVFGVVLILMMRFRPAGLLPANRVKEELQTPAAPPVASNDGGAA